jgi:predicted metalloprotease
LTILQEQERLAAKAVCGGLIIGKGLRGSWRAFSAGVGIATLLTAASLSSVPAGHSANTRQPSVQQFDKFLLEVARDVNSFWGAAFDNAGLPYRTPKLFIVDRNQQVNEPCDARPVRGTLPNAFWCSVDDNVYLFSNFLRRGIYPRAGAFGVAYVVAHEWGHHIQKQLHLWRVIRRRHIRTIKIETQADCFAGIWSKSAYDRGIVNDVDIEEIIAATDLGGDARGTPSNAQGAHGQSGLRYAWWKNGFVGGSTDDCRTF